MYFSTAAVSVWVCVCVCMHVYAWVCVCADSGFNIDQRTVSAFIGHDIKDFCHVNDIDQLLRHLSEGTLYSSTAWLRSYLRPQSNEFVKCWTLDFLFCSAVISITRIAVLCT